MKNIISLGNHSQKGDLKVTSDSTEAGSDYDFPQKAKQNKTKFNVSYTFLEENQELKEICNHFSIQQVSALGNTNVFTEVKKYIPVNVII